ncbi:MAG: cell division protein SepF [Christensenellales bacterium]|jgi:FtsZ-interacting cell division protein YlmF
MAARGFFNSFLKFIGIEDEEDEESSRTYSAPQKRPPSPSPSRGAPRRPSRAALGDELEDEPRPRPQARPGTRQPASAKPSNVVDFRQGARPETVVYTLTQLSEVNAIITELIENKTALVLLGKMDRDAQRAVDMLSGAAFALNATFLMTSGDTLLITPPFVRVDQVDASLGRERF